MQSTCTEQNYISGLLILNLTIMNTLCLENYGVSKMETREMKVANGGGRFAKFVGWCYGTIARYHHRGGVHTQYGIS